MWICGIRDSLRGRAAVSHPAIGAGIEPKSCGGLRPSFSSHVRWCERGAPVWSCGDRVWLEVETCGFLPGVVAGIRDQKLFDVGGSFLETTKGFGVVLDPELDAALLEVGFHRRATGQRLLSIRLILRSPGRGSLGRIVP